MRSRFLPREIDNTYRGHNVALWLLTALLLLKTVIGVNCIWHGYDVAMNADGIPLNTFPSAAAGEVVSLFAVWGLAQVTLSFLGFLVLIRYRSLISFWFALLLSEQLVRKVIVYFLPGARTGRPPGFYVNVTILTVLIAGLALSLPRGAVFQRSAHAAE